MLDRQNRLWPAQNVNVSRNKAWKEIETMKYTDGNIMVYAQSADGAPVGAALETVSKAAELAKANGEEVIAVVFGKDTDTKTVITAGASKVLVAGEEGLPAEENPHQTYIFQNLRRNISRRQSIWQEPRRER